MLNKVILIGNLGQDPELKSLPSGASVCNFSLATKESWSKDGDRQERTEWHRINVFGKTAENAAKYLKKGSKIYVEGRIQSRQWEDKDGNKRTSFEIVASAITFLDTKASRTEDHHQFDQDQDVPF